MKYFSYLDDEQIDKIFYKAPKELNSTDLKELLERALGATLYMPALKENIAEIILNKKIDGLVSVVFCLEDAIGDKQVKEAEENLLRNLKEINAKLIDDCKKIKKIDLPLIFIRVRNPEHLLILKERFKEELNLITGFTLPKFDSKNAERYLNNIKEISTNKKFYAMPILETESVIDKKSREFELDKLLELLLENKEWILNIRIGATDLSGIYGLRRNQDTTIYDIEVIKNFLGDVINIFKKHDFVISGVVWEYFNNKSNNRVLKPQLRQTPFVENMGKDGIEYRKHLLDEYTDSLLREIVLDKVNGFLGKTVIHPSHLVPVQAMYVVTHEEYLDAKGIVERNDGELGVFKSGYSNKMNEIKPHLKWAKEIIKRAEIYGVFNEHENYTSLFV